MNKEHDMNDIGTSDVVTDEQLAQHLSQMSHLLAGRTGGCVERTWKHGLLDQMLEHPSTKMRCDLAAWGSLSILRKTCVDPEPAVRYASTFNPFVIDVDIQTALAGDIRAEIVEALIDNIDLGWEATLVVIAGPHVAARYKLAQRRLASELLDLLAVDPDMYVREAAMANLGRRALRSAA
jgi:hypothetical protein